MRPQTWVATAVLCVLAMSRVHAQAAIATAEAAGDSGETAAEAAPEAHPDKPVANGRARIRYREGDGMSIEDGETRLRFRLYVQPMVRFTQNSLFTDAQSDWIVRR